MGPAAWAAVARALALALSRSLFGGRDSVPAIAARGIHRAIVNQKLEEAHAMLRDLAYRNEAEYKRFLTEYRDSLPPEFLSDFRGQGN